MATAVKPIEGQSDQTFSEQVNNAPKPSSKTPLTISIDSDAYKYVAANLVKEEVALFGAARASKLVPDKMNHLINEFIKSRAKQLAKQAATRALTIQFKDDIESATRQRLSAVYHE